MSTAQTGEDRGLFDGFGVLGRGKETVLEVDGRRWRPNRMSGRREPAEHLQRVHTGPCVCWQEGMVPATTHTQQRHEEKEGKESGHLLCFQRQGDDPRHHGG